MFWLDKPDPLSNCSLLNQTHQSLLVKCAHRLDSGLNQTFVAEIHDIQTQKPLKNISSQIPVFQITGLNNTVQIEIHLYVTNEYGKSDPIKFKAYLPQKPEETPTAGM